MQDNISELTWEGDKNSVESSDLSSFSELTLDISKCADKNNTDFVTSIKKAVALNFNTKTNKIKLFLQK